MMPGVWGAIQGPGDTDTVDINWIVRIISLSITETNAFYQVIPALILEFWLKTWFWGKKKIHSCQNYIKEATVS